MGSRKIFLKKNFKIFIFERQRETARMEEEQRETERERDRQTDRIKSRLQALSC